jgi:hypothetical protein
MIATVLVQSDTQPIVRVTLQQRGSRSPIDLSDAQSVVFRFQIEDGTVVERLMRVENASMGIVLYQFQVGELQPGALRCEVTVRYNNGRELTTLQPKEFGVRARQGG